MSKQIVKKENRTIPHPCPHILNLIEMKSPKFHCDNLKWNGLKRRFLCTVCICPYDDAEYPMELVELAYGE